MSTATVGVTSAVDSALRRAFSEASVRLAPETKITDVIAALGTLGIVAEITDGVLVLRQDQTQFNTSLALRNFSKRPEHAKFFVQEGQHPAQWSTKTKIEYINKNGEAAYRKLCQSPVLDAGIKVLDPNMRRADYLQLTRQERMSFISEYGDAAVAKIFQKAK